ncbi:hypothetical protein BCR34DRAFT_625667 [Clohesyomyces aquaticus]|uniref:N-acetyltransferase domain-containing protein n=1 Tax=Clohesyomyces aquaticus TaxID=1231657 RepID=A0A1Y1ZH75_9PLEO|nr:hypothetical protein BCR34DRAFT_625667 [Clohesyomyces aquaticus]
MANSDPCLRLARFSDLQSIAQCWYEGFFDDEVIGQIMHPNRKEFPEDVYWWLLRGIRERFWDWRHQFVVVTVMEGGKERIVGAADWRRVGDGGKSLELGAWDARNLIKPAIALYHQASLQFFPNRAADPKKASFLTSAVAQVDQYWTGKHAECWDLHVCGVHPDFQGKGIGKMLVDWGTGMADKEGVSASVICGEKNRGFYAKGELTEEMGDLSSGKRGGIVLFRSPRATSAA